MEVLLELWTWAFDFPPKTLSSQIAIKEKSGWFGHKRCGFTDIFASFSATKLSPHAKRRQTMANKAHATESVVLYET